MTPEGWVAVPFSTVAEYKTGRTPARANPNYWAENETGVPWLTISDMVEFDTVTNTKEEITRAALMDVFRGKRVRAGTLLMSFKLTIGRIATLGKDACHNEAIISIYPKPGVDQRYLGYFLGQVDYSALQDRQVKGNTLNKEKIDRIEVLLPPFAEQSLIADVLDLIRCAIKLQDTSLATTQELKCAAMRVLFTHGLKGEAQKETEIGPMSESWDVVDFGSVREWLQYGTSTRCTYEPTGFPVLRIPNIEPGYINTEDIKFGTLSPDQAIRYRLEDGDLIFIRTNGVIERLGACAVYAGHPAGALFASYLIRARLKLDQINPYFAAHFFGSEVGTSIVAGRSTPAADGKYNLNTGTIDSLPIPLPPTLDEQQEIVAVLDAIDRKINLHRRKREVLDELFRALLHKLMTGEIRVADLDLAALEKTAELVGAK
jgi:type I restriction enzyme S subunit